MKEFNTAARRASEEEKGEEPIIPFKVDGRDCIAYPPDETQLAILVSGISGAFNDESDQISTLVNFSMAILDKGTHSYLSRRLLDRDDDFDLDALMEIMEFIVEATAETPTKPSSASISTQERPGKRSTVSASTEE